MNENILEFSLFLQKHNIPVWIRHIIVEGITDNRDDLIRLGEYIGKLSNLKALDVLPYHTMGVHKYKELGISYPLDGIPPLSLQDAETAKKHIIEGIKNVR